MDVLQLAKVDNISILQKGILSSTLAKRCLLAEVEEQMVEQTKALTPTNYEPQLIFW